MFTGGDGNVPPTEANVHASGTYVFLHANDLSRAIQNLLIQNNLKELEMQSLRKNIDDLKKQYDNLKIRHDDMQAHVTQLQEMQSLRKIIADLQKKYEYEQIRHDGMQSHAKQLQYLVNEKIQTIETMKKKMNPKLEKDLEKLQKKNEELLKDMYLVVDVVFGREKLDKRRMAILRKYDKKGKKSDNVVENQRTDHERDKKKSQSRVCSEEVKLPEKRRLNKNMQIAAHRETLMALETMRLDIAMLTPIAASPEELNDQDSLSE